MNDMQLKPWLEEPDIQPHVRDLLRVGQVDGPSDADLARLAGRLAPAVGLAVLAAPTGALADTTAPANPAGFAPAKVTAAQGLALKTLLPGMLKLAVVVGTVGLTAMLWPRTPMQPVSVSRAPRIEQSAPKPAPLEAPQAVVPQAELAPREQPLDEAPAPVVPSKVKERGERRAKPSTPKSESNVLAPSTESELTLIRRAQDLRGKPSQALAVLAAHERTYPDGMLAQEREVLAIEALLAAGRRTDAEKRAVRMEQKFSDSAHLRRVRVLLETSSPE